MSPTTVPPQTQVPRFGTRAITAALRVPGRTLPIPGWFPLVVERVHPQLRYPAAVQTHSFAGVRMFLDLREYVQRRIYYDAYEVAEASFLRRLLRRGDVVIDVGANVGYFTVLAAAHIGPCGHVHAFEPVGANYEALEANVRLNGFDNVTMNRCAVAEKRGDMTLGLWDAAEDTGGAGSGGTSGHYAEGGTGLSVTATTTSLDAYLRGATTSRIRLVKIDVEGVEPRVLAGMAHTLAHDPPDAVLVELNDEVLRRHGATPDDVTARLAEAGYGLFRLTVLGRLRRLRLRRRTGGRVVNIVAVRPGCELAPGLGGSW